MMKNHSGKVCPEGWGIDENYAMLFVFDHNDHHKMWMKDMKFSVDMIWINDKSASLCKT